MIFGKVGVGLLRPLVFRMWNASACRSSGYGTLLPVDPGVERFCLSVFQVCNVATSVDPGVERRAVYALYLCSLRSNDQ
jgi:hypothetical protein